MSQTENLKYLKIWLEDFQKTTLATRFLSKIQALINS